jgi:F420-0:gamma-glutamyl ligase
MQIIPIKTRIINPPQDDIYGVIDEFCPELKENDVLLITSKILSIHQGRCISMQEVHDKDELIKKEADYFIPREECPGQLAILTIKNNTLIASAGIDESNANGHYIMWPEFPEKEAEKICNYLKEKFSLNKLAVIITDSHSIPLRYGVLGISIGFYGLEPFNDYRGKQDIFGKILKMSQSNVVDSLATIGVLAMGEGDEQKPMAIIRDAEAISFTNENKFSDVYVPIKEDIYFPILEKFYKK